MNTFRLRLIRTLLCTALLIGLCDAARARQAVPDPSSPQQVTPPSAGQPFTALWMSDKASLGDDLLPQIDAGIRQQAETPDHIVVFVHGFDTERAASAAQFKVLAERAIPQFEQRGKRVAVVGLQWRSGLGPPKLWVTQVLSATLGLDSDNPYLSKVALAENIGRTGARHLLLHLNEAFPNAQINVMAHSLGCDLSRNALMPFLQTSLVRNQFMPAETPIFAPDARIRAGLVSFAGADIDYDLLYRNRDTMNRASDVQLNWLTVGGVKNPDRRDLILSIRALARGDRAMGNTIPRMGRRQIDAVLSRRGLVLDGNNIPLTHDYLKYYDEARMKRLVSAAVALRDPSRPDPLLSRLDEIVHAPADPAALQKFFQKGAELSVTYYTLWRLEGICCGGPRHLSDGYLEWLSILLGDSPDAVAAQRWKGPCLVVRDGWWPTPGMMIRAEARQPGEAGRPQFIDPPLLFPTEP